MPLRLYEIFRPSDPAEVCKNRIYQSWYSVQTIIKTSLSDAYDEMGNDVDYWKQYIKSETVAAITDVWDDAHEDIQPFLEDWEYVVKNINDKVDIYLKKL